MDITKIEGVLTVAEAVKNDDPLCAVIAFDGSMAYVAPADEAFEHHILLQKAGLQGTEIDRFFRIMFNKSGADWTFICPSDYRGIADRRRRISAFYSDGFAVLSRFLAEMGYFVDISIPKRYRRHFNELNDN